MTILLVFWILAHSWYSEQCCQDRDCHPVACEEIHASGEFYTYQGLHLAKEKAQVSPDGACHICVHNKRVIMCLWLGGAA